MIFFPFPFPLCPEAFGQTGKGKGLAGWRFTQGGGQKKRQEVQKEVAYLQNHRHRMDYAAARRAAELQGAGAMEFTCRQYQCRFKRPGQFWSFVGDLESLVFPKKRVTQRRKDGETQEEDKDFFVTH